MNVHERILTLCKERNISLSKLAKTAGLAETTVYDWFNEVHSNPSLKALEDICAVFNISLAEFFSDIKADKLSKKEIRLLELFNKLPLKQQDKALTMLELLTEL